MSTVYLISGANRGIGLGLVTHLALRSNTIVFAGARNPDSAVELNKLVQAYPGVVHTVKLTSGDAADNAAAVEVIRSVAGRLDVVIANAGIANSYTSAAETPIADMRTHWDVNVGGPLVLFQSVLPLFRATSTAAPKFIIISSGLGSIEKAGGFNGLAAYRGSKAAANFLARELHFEHEQDGLVAFPLCPGPVDTDMLGGVQKNHEAVAKATGNSVEVAVKGLMHVIDTSTRETHGGKYINFASESIPW